MQMEVAKRVTYKMVCQQFQHLLNYITPYTLGILRPHKRKAYTKAPPILDKTHHWVATFFKNKNTVYSLTASATHGICDCSSNCSSVLTGKNFLMSCADGWLRWRRIRVETFVLPRDGLCVLGVVSVLLVFLLLVRGGRIRTGGRR